MSAYVFETPNEKVISGAAALVMHGLFVALLVFSVSWQKREPAAMVAELWSSLPQVSPPRVEPPPPPPRAEPEPPKPQPKAEPKPVPKVEPKPQPKADIDLREKKEKERKAKEAAALEKKKREQERAEALKQKQAKEAADAKRREQEQAEAHRKLAQQEAAAQAEAQKKQAAAQAAARAAEIDKYKRAIAERIKHFITEPPSLQGNPQVELDITVLPGGEVLGVRTRTPSGQVAWDNAVERAILRAQPLPLPPADSPIFREFRELNLKFRPKE